MMRGSDSDGSDAVSHKGGSLHCGGRETGPVPVSGDLREDHQDESSQEEIERDQVLDSNFIGLSLIHI